MTHDMRHLDFIRIVANADVEYVDRKDRSYGGSWKRGGGRSAWFMLRRKIDRMLEFMKRPEEPKGFSLEKIDENLECPTVSSVRHLRDCYVSEDIFGKIRDNPDGSDGTVLAEIRDLRRYLMLVEAEMMARGVIMCNDTPPIGIVVATQQDLAQAAGALPEKLDGHYEALRTVPRMREQKPFSVDVFGGYAPFLVRKSWLDENDISLEATNRFYRMFGTGADTLYALEPMIVGTSNEKIYPMNACYRTIKIDNGLVNNVLRIDAVPSEIREYFPYLRFEVNAVEHGELPEWQRPMYYWSQSENKYRLSVLNTAWAKEI